MLIYNSIVSPLFAYFLGKYVYGTLNITIMYDYCIECSFYTPFVFGVYNGMSQRAQNNIFNEQKTDIELHE